MSRCYPWSCCRFSFFCAVQGASVAAGEAKATALMNLAAFGVREFATRCQIVYTLPQQTLAMTTAMTRQDFQLGPRLESSLQSWWCLEVGALLFFTCGFCNVVTRGVINTPPRWSMTRMASQLIMRKTAKSGARERSYPFTTNRHYLPRANKTNKT